MEEDWMMSKILGVACACALIPVTSTVSASSLDFGIIAPTAGTINYAGGINPLTGTGINVDNILGSGTPAHPGTTLTCTSCSLDFTTGASTGGWNFSGGGTINITGIVTAAGITSSSALLTGTFNSATVTDFGGGMLSFKILGSSFIDTKNTNLLTYFGLPGGNYQGGTNISFSTNGAPSVGSAFTSKKLFSGDIVNSPVVPVPAAVWLFGSGLLGLAGIARRK